MDTDHNVSSTFCIKRKKSNLIYPKPASVLQKLPAVLTSPITRLGNSHLAISSEPDAIWRDDETVWASLFSRDVAHCPLLFGTQASK
ncbi:hypothetical protein E2C01_039407 [Portunus trituberculatus]|uniref:Uncharacterized protein n=1 Tax=Portunus trituberculatus TaxID=210409 RepID=A0A5B7FDK1_PORTR|nr:hypothetical protein [Portunus trituberculatus]